ncbi:Clp protease N-terminal domain-containing protein [Actinomadura macrotermitis]|uniref:ATP-dependent Clp protease ATP-binding subunit ClpC1 n=1 Tax=Actinomadura macrotermitis TaxID=2585200 RepID=A0A7K0BLY8_9ACTN|nr:Clp protease N-terminal domain-containing protein [Actinomadura macrotermitis]MQY02171.1 ATP-dependent Clp protease ATP-binding subunit ClpC1 [Actinomadura macrotermitis]
MFERFTDEARSVVERARDEALGLRAERIGSEHVLLGVIAGQGPAALALRERGVTAENLRPRVAHLAERSLDAEALRSIGIDLAAVREATEDSFGTGALDAPPGRFRSGRVPFGPDAKKSLELALRQALRLGQKHIADGHILLGLLQDGRLPAARALAEAGVDLDALREDVERRVLARVA